MLSFVAMEPPDSLAPQDVRDRKAELLEAMRPLPADDAAFDKLGAILAG